MKKAKKKKKKNVEKTCLANQEEVVSKLDQSKVSSFALDERKVKKKCPLSRPISIQ